MDIGVDGDRFEHEIGVPYFSRFLREVGLRRMGFHVFGDEAERIADVFRGATAGHLCGLHAIGKEHVDSVPFLAIGEAGPKPKPTAR